MHTPISSSSSYCFSFSVPLNEVEVESLNTRIVGLLAIVTMESGTLTCQEKGNRMINHTLETMPCQQ